MTKRIESPLNPTALTLFSAALVGVAAADPALAYVGPGAGLTAIGTVLALIGAVLLAVLGFVWYPVKRLIRARRATAEPVEPAKDER